MPAAVGRETGGCCFSSSTRRGLQVNTDSMGKEFSRTRRVGEQIQRELAQLIREEVKDPRVGMVTLNFVQVSRDLGHAKVFVTVMGVEDPAPSVAALNRAAGFLRGQLGRRLAVRTVPHLRFVYDESVERGSRVSSVIDEAIAADKAKNRDRGEQE